MSSQFHTTLDQRLWVHWFPIVAGGRWPVAASGSPDSRGLDSLEMSFCGAWTGRTLGDESRSLQYIDYMMIIHHASSIDIINKYIYIYIMLIIIYMYIYILIHMYAVYKYVYLMCSTTTHRHPQTCWKWAGIKPRHHLQQRVAQIVHQPRMMKIIAQGRILAVSAGNLSSLRLIDMWYVYIYIVFGAKKQWCHMSWKKTAAPIFAEFQVIHAIHYLFWSSLPQSRT